MGGLEVKIRFFKHTCKRDMIMKALLIIASLIGFAGLIFLSFLRYCFCNVKAEKEYDPKLRIYGKTSFLVWFIVVLSFTCLGSLAYFISYFGRTDNYNGAFALKGDWIPESSISFNSDEADNIYIYRLNNETPDTETVEIQVRHLPADQLAIVKADFDEKIMELLIHFKKRLSEIKAEAKTQKKVINQQAKEKQIELKESLKAQKAELKAALTENKEQRKAALKAVPGLFKETFSKVKNVNIKNSLIHLKERFTELRAETKTQRKNIKQQAKEKQIELKELIKVQKVELKTALKKNKEQRKTALDTVSELLKETLAQVKAEKKIVKNKWLPNQNTNTYTALSFNREYTVTLKSSDMLNVVIISPYGFGSGYFDGMVYPGKKIGSLLSLDLYPSFKMAKTGKIYIIGFVSGITFNCVLLIWLLCIVIHRITILSWRKKWSMINVDEKVVYITRLNENVKNKNIKNVEILNERFTELFAVFDNKSPQTVLASFDKQSMNLFKKVGGFLGDVFTAGETSLENAKEHYKKLANIYKYFVADYKISLGNLNVVNTEYIFIQKKAILYMQKIKEIMAKLPLKERQSFDKLDSVKFDQGLLGDKAIQDIFKSIEQSDAIYRIQAEKSYENSIKTANSIANGIFNFTGEYLSTQMNKNKGILSKEDFEFGLAGLGVGLAASGLIMVFEGIGQYFGKISINNEAKTRIAESELKLKQGIEDIVKTNRPKVESLIERIKELNLSLNESMERYVIVFNNVNSYIFPIDDKSKTKEARQKKKNKGEEYFTGDEFQKIMELREFNKFLGTLTDTDF
jgi:hypothetical protein